jgi:hypothetical protein
VEGDGGERRRAEEGGGGRRRAEEGGGAAGEGAARVRGGRPSGELGQCIPWVPGRDRTMHTESRRLGWKMGGERSKWNTPLC